MNSMNEVAKLSPEAQRILSSIISLGTDIEDNVASLRCRPPGAHDLYAFCELLAEAPAEERLQRFLVQHPGFLMGLFGMNDGGDLALIAKPRIGTKYVADYAVVQVFQGGAVVFLIEIETAHEPIFTAKLSPARRLQSALTQIDEWREWINPNRITFCRDLINHACRLPLYNLANGSGNGYRFGEPEYIREVCT